MPGPEKTLIFVPASSGRNSLFFSRTALSLWASSESILPAVLAFSASLSVSVNPLWEEYTEYAVFIGPRLIYTAPAIRARTRNHERSLLPLLLRFRKAFFCFLSPLFSSPSALFIRALKSFFCCLTEAANSS